jgi:ribosomal protein L11 methyltransferase
MKDKFIQLLVTTDRPVNDLVVGFLSDVGAEGFIEEESELKCYFAENKWRPEYRDDVTRFLGHLRDEGKIGSFNVDVSEIMNQDWNMKWEESIVPIEVTDNIAIKPSWKEYNGNAKIVIEIDPKMSFGTGHHETTRMMVRLLEKYVKGGDKILDVGTGTGVLAIAAVKLGANHCVAVDKDEWSIENSLENIRRNSVSEKVSISRGEVASVAADDFDIVVANLNRNTLLYIEPELRKRCKKGGVLLLAGVLTLDEKDIADSYSKSGFKILETLHEAEWSALALTNSGRTV